MRITNQMMANNMMANLQSSMRRLDRYFEQLETGNKFSVPSDDPAATFFTLRAKSEIALNDQLQENIQMGKGWLEVTDSALNSLGEVYHRIRELMIYSANGDHEVSSFEAFHSEVEQIRESLLEIANVRYGERFVFGGHRTTTPPFIDADLPYQGDEGEIKIRLGRGVEIPINKTGSEIFSPLFSVLEEFGLYLQSGDTNSISNNSIAHLDEAFDKFLAIRSDVGACSRRFELSAARLISQEIELEKSLGDAQSADIVKVLTKLKLEESVYRSALAAGARIVQPSLMDFLR